MKEREKKERKKESCQDSFISTTKNIHFHLFFIVSLFLFLFIHSAHCLSSYIHTYSYHSQIFINTHIHRYSLTHIIHRHSSTHTHTFIMFTHHIPPYHTSTHHVHTQYPHTHTHTPSTHHVHTIHPHPHTHTQHACGAVRVRCARVRGGPPQTRRAAQGGTLPRGRNGGHQDAHGHGGTQWEEYAFCLTF